MAYHDDYQYLKDKIDLNRDQIALEDAGLLIRNFSFESKHYNILPGESSYHDQGITFSRTPDFQHAISPEINELLNLADSQVNENRFFRYSLFMPYGKSVAGDVIVMLHGLNEKNWIKYYPWAKNLVEKTGKAVLLFPIAFHMNRAPAEWSNMRMMNDLKYIRQSLFPAIAGSSFANVAMSTRLHILPLRFFWSGLETYYDAIRLITQIREGKHPAIHPGAGVNIFAYSIGTFLSEVLLMSNTDGFFDRSKLFMFCGGPVFNRMSPVRKTIIDSEANIALYAFFLEHLDNYLKNDARLAHYFSPRHPEGMVFKSMIDYTKMLEFREEKIAAISSRLMAVALKKDRVVPSYEVLNTLTGAGGDIPTPVKVVDFDFPYTHENPFPLNPKYHDEVDAEYERIFSLAADFLA